MNASKIVGVEADVVNGVLTFNVLGCGQFQVNVAAIAGAAYHDLTDTGRAGILHGFKQKVADKAALSRNPDTGRSATPRDKFEAMRELAQHLNDGGAWSMRQPSKDALNRAALFEAVAEVSGRDASVVEARYRDREDSVLRTLLERADIAAAYAKRTARDSGRAADLLAELEG